MVSRNIFFIILLVVFGVSSCKDKTKINNSDFSDEIVLQSYDDSSKMITVQYNNADTNIQIKTYFFKNGQKYMGGELVRGQRNGEWEAYNEIGQLLTKGNYKNGINHGYKVVYYENGKIRYEGNYDNGKKIGKWQFYSADGSLAKELDFNPKEK